MVSGGLGADKEGGRYVGVASACATTVRTPTSRAVSPGKEAAGPLGARPDALREGGDGDLLAEHDLAACNSLERTSDVVGL